MNEQQRKALDWMLTTPPSDCEEDGTIGCFLDVMKRALLTTNALAVNRRVKDENSD